ncbi:hypothetical protein [Nocardia sp. NBC_00416]|uniref:hypothetical protein n=1 Tax=Nocardia sp. NBC_00416 TaxID=2975991 RepID=UPI002E1CD332
MADRVTVDPAALRPVVDGLAEVRESLLASLSRVADGMSVGPAAWGDDSFGSEFAYGPEGFVTAVDSVVAGVQAVADAVLSIEEGLAETAALHTVNEEISADELYSAGGAGRYGATGGGFGSAGSPSPSDYPPGSDPVREAPSSGDGAAPFREGAMPAGQFSGDGGVQDRDAGAEPAIGAAQNPPQSTDIGGVTPGSVSTNAGWIDSAPSGSVSTSATEQSRAPETSATGPSGSGPAGAAGGSGGPGGGARQPAKQRKRSGPAKREDSAANTDISASEMFSSAATRPEEAVSPAPAGSTPADSSPRADRKAETPDRDESGRDSPLQAAPIGRTAAPDTAT